MKEPELRTLTTCANCGRKIGQTGVPIFWKVTAERFMLNLPALQRQQGLAMMFGGNGAIASAMGPDEDMAKPLTESITMMICDECAIKEMNLFVSVENALQPTQPQLG